MSGALQKYVAEFVGTFALVFIAAGSNAVDYLSHGSLGLIGMAVATGVTVMVMIYAIGHISGAHINPAVTIAMATTGKISTIDCFAYIIAQISGACAASFMLMQIFPSALDSVNFGATSLGANIAPDIGILIEAILTFLLVFVIYGAAVDTRSPPGLAGFAIGACVLLAILFGGTLTGASMNPARSFGPALIAGYWTDHLVYWIGPISGGIVAALLYDNVFIHENVLDEKKDAAIEGI
ncbi:MAG: tonoplast intrinsic protein (Aquaporin) [Methanolobus sp. T82-4]|jgi:MIP family channel proteins|nr:MAG: tonoplast intrinsic protein (Aquaporin) [Methanolobus sp. T82-4]